MQPVQPLSPKERENIVFLTPSNRAETKPPPPSSHHLLKASGMLSRRLERRAGAARGGLPARQRRGRGAMGTVPQLGTSPGPSSVARAAPVPAFFSQLSPKHCCCLLPPSEGSSVPQPLGRSKAQLLSSAHSSQERGNHHGHWRVHVLKHNDSSSSPKQSGDKEETL